MLPPPPAGLTSAPCGSAIRPHRSHPQSRSRTQQRLAGSARRAEPHPKLARPVHRCHALLPRNSGRTRRLDRPAAQRGDHRGAAAVPPDSAPHRRHHTSAILVQAAVGHSRVLASWLASPAERRMRSAPPLRCRLQELQAAAAGAGTEALFEPLQLGDVHLKHRVVMAPLTRCRSAWPARRGPTPERRGALRRAAPSL